jgi:hypothetical protein
LCRKLRLSAADHFSCKKRHLARLTLGVNTDIKILLEFLVRFGPEAAGRAEASTPQSEAAEKLERFARGQCSPEERAEVCEMLRLHPAWLRWLADRVKMARARREVGA